jgi:hypothetical protein
MGSPPEPADGRPRRRRPWGLLALAGVFIAFGVSEALGTQGTLAESSLQDADRASSGETGTVEPGGGGNAPTAPGPGYDSLPGYPPLPLPGDTPGDGGANDPPDDPVTPPPPPPPPPPPRPNPPSRPLLITNDRGKALFTLPALGAGRARARCVTVKYRGPHAARVHLFATRWGTGLDRYLKLTVTRGTARGRHAGSCKGFKPDAQDYVGAGRGVLFRGRLAAFPKTAEAAARARGSSAWQDGESHTYRVRVVITSTNAAQGRSASFDLVWQALS